MPGVADLPEAPPLGAGVSATLGAALEAKRAAGDYRPRTHHLLGADAPKYTNRLILESSPYLLQHAHNPVDWRAWGDEAIAKIVDATGKSLEYRDAPISSREFKAEFPNAVSWTALHPTLLGGGIVIVALVLAIGIPIAWALLSK